MRFNRRRIWPAVKYILAIVIIGLVARQFVIILQKDEFRQHPLSIEWEWLVPAGLLYLGAHTCWGSFWVRAPISRARRVRPEPRMLDP